MGRCISIIQREIGRDLDCQSYLKARHLTRMSHHRHYDNPFDPEKHEDQLKDVRDSIRKHRDDKFERFLQKVMRPSDREGGSVYTGSAGVAWAILKVAKETQRPELVSAAKDILLKARKRLRLHQDVAGDGTERLLVQ